MIEDLCEQPPEIESPSVPKTRDLLRRAQVNGTFATPILTAGEQAYLADTVASIKLFDSLYPSSVLLGNDALAVIQKHSKHRWGGQLYFFVNPAARLIERKTVLVRSSPNSPASLMSRQA